MTGKLDKVVCVLAALLQTCAGPPHSYPVPDAVPQVTEIHGMFAAEHQVPATAAAAQMAAAAAAAAGQHHHAHHHQQQQQGQGQAHDHQQQQQQSVHQQQPQGHSDVQPQVTELHGLLGASAGTAAEAQLAAAAAAALAASGGGTPAGSGSGTPAAVGSTGGPVTGDWRPPLPQAGHSWGLRGMAAAAAAAAGGAAIGIGNGGSSTPHGRASGAGSSKAAAGAGAGGAAALPTPRSASGDAPTPAAAGVGGRVHYSPPAVNFSPHAQDMQAASGGAVGGDADFATNHSSFAGSGAMPEQHHNAAGAAAAAAAGSDKLAGRGTLQQQEQQQEVPHAPASPAVAVVQECNSQLGQQDGSQGTPQGSAGLGRVGSVPPPEVQPAADAAAEVEGPPAAAVGYEVVEQHTVSQAAGECAAAADAYILHVGVVM